MNELIKNINNLFSSCPNYILEYKIGESTTPATIVD